MPRNDDDRDERSSKKGFNYRPRSPETMRERAAQSPDLYDGPTKAKYPTYRPKEGKNKIRIFPREGDVDHYALTIYVHFGVGPDNATYLCLNRMKGEPCPVCEERKELQREGADKDDIKKYNFSQRSLVWLLNRDAEGEGPKLWAVPHTTDQKFINACIDEDSGSVLLPEHPDDGYDIRFTVVGQKQQTKYENVKPSRDPCPISDDERLQTRWLNFIHENPLEDALQFYSYDHIKDVLGGKAKKKAEDDDDDTPPARVRGRKLEDDEDDEKPPVRRRTTVKEPEDEDDEKPPVRRRTVKEPEDDEDEKPPVVRRRTPVKEPDEDDEKPPRTRSRTPLEEELDDEIPERKRTPKPSNDDADEEDEEDKTKVAAVQGKLDQLSTSGTRKRTAT